MEMKWLQTFIVAAEHENFRKASELLFLTQPAVTKHIQRLEHYIQSELFTRAGKAVTLSVEGHRFLTIAKAILQQYEEGMESFRGWQQGYTRQLTIATAPQIASSILPPILKAFIAHEPTIDVQLQVSNSYEVIREVTEGAVDVGLTRTYTPQASVHCEAVLEEPVVLVAPFATTLNEATLLTKYRLITHNHPVYWDDLLREVKRYYPTTQTFRINQIEATKKFIEQGLGVSYLPYSMIQKELEAELLTLITPEKIALPVSQTYVVTKVTTREADAFIRFFKHRLTT